jgi:Ca2+-binding RTX toxin-like protein
VELAVTTLQEAVLSHPDLARAERRLRLRGAVIAVAALAATAAVPAAAQAADSCRASAAREVAPGQLTSEPVVANPDGTPCVTDHREAASGQPVGAVTVAFPQADTRRAPGVIAASSSVDGAEFTLGAVPVSVGVVRASQTVSCANGTSVASGSSRVDALVIAGTTVPIVADRPLDTGVGSVRVRANQDSGGTRQALVLEDGAGRQVVLGEASASGDACATTSGGSGGSGGPGSGGLGTGLAQICPVGASYDAGRNLCVIREGEGGGSDGIRETIVVGAPYQGQRGGSLLSLDEARQRAKDGSLPNSPCLRGKGPQFVVLGTPKADTITGANSPDRILALGGRDRVSSGLGDDCIDGAGGRDRLTGDNDADRIYGGSGGDQLSGSADNDRLVGNSGRDILQGSGGKDRLSGGTGGDAVNGGSGTDRLSAGSGNDSINTGFGRDRVDSGSGRDAVNAATAGPASKRIRCGRGVDTLRINRNELRTHRGCEKVYSIR